MNDGVRTRDLHHGKVPRYQLRHIHVVASPCTVTIRVHVLTKDECCHYHHRGVGHEKKLKNEQNLGLEPSLPDYQSGVHLTLVARVVGEVSR